MANHPRNDLYEIPGLKDKIVPRVTAILDLLDKPALSAWKANTTAKWFKVKLEDIKAGHIDVNTMDLKDIVKRAVSYHNELAKEQADIGTLIHKRIEEFFKAKVAGEFEKCAAMMTQKVGVDIQAPWAAFVDWMMEHSVEPIYAEKVVWQTEEPIYAGTLDIFAKVDGKDMVIDAKSSGAIYHEMRLQVVAYAEALASCVPDLRIYGAAILRLDKISGMPEYQEIQGIEYPFLASQFNSLCAYWHARRRMQEAIEDASRIKI